MSKIIDRNKKKNVFTGAAAGLQRTEEVASQAYNFNTTNPFIRYQQMTTVSPHVFVSHLKTSLSLVKKGRFKSKDKKVELEWNKWMKKVGFQSQVNTMSSLLLMNGTYVAIFTGTNKDDFGIRPIHMSSVTLWPEGFDPINNQPKVAVGDNPALMGPPTKVCVNEGCSPDQVEVYEIEDIIYGALFPFNYILKDIKERPSWGMYGISLLESVADIIVKYLTVIDGYSNFVHKYGQGRLHVDYKALEELIANGQIESAELLLRKMISIFEELEENEDIITVGADIKPLTMNGNISVTDFKMSLESDIQVGLLQNGITMGNTGTSTFASGYVAENERMLTLEALQSEIVGIINRQVVPKRKELLGQNDSDIEFCCEEISRAQIPLLELLKSLEDDVIDFNEVRTEAGFEPREIRPDNKTNPALISALKPTPTPINNSGVGSGNGLGSGNPSKQGKPAAAKTVRKAQDTATKQK